MRKAISEAVIRVFDGRGFIIEHNHERLVVTAAHCLPHLSPAHGMSYTHERTHQDALAPLGARPTVWAECFFVDPVADIAVLNWRDQGFQEARRSMAPDAQRPVDRS